MHRRNLLLILLVLTFLFSCREKETFPDLANELEGNWTIDSALILYSIGDTTAYYNPKDSAEIGIVNVQKIDALRVKVNMLLKKKTGKVLFENSFEAELSRDFENKGFIKFSSFPGSYGGYNPDAKILSLASFGMNMGEIAGTSAWFECKR